jgi:hypothetical protein
VCFVWAPRVVTWSKPMGKFGKCSESAGELHMDVVAVFRFSGITLLDEIGQCRRKWLLLGTYNLALMLLGIW